MQRLLLGIDRLSTLVGKAFAWSILVLTGVVAYEVFVRYVFRAPTSWGFDVSYMLYGTLFMMAGAYTLSRNGHVRGDFIYRMLSAPKQAMLDLALYVLFFFPGIIAFMISGWFYFADSYRQNERSMFSPSGPVIWPFKFLIPLVGVLLLLQGLVEVVRCVQCIRAGAWPPRLHDVEEMDQRILAEAEAAREADQPGAAMAEHARGATRGPSPLHERAGDQQDGR